MLEYEPTRTRAQSWSKLGGQQPGEGTQQSFILGGSAARSKPFPFYMSFFRMPSIENGPPPRMP